MAAPVREPKSCVIEFLGLPGSGKTKVTHALAGALADRGLVVHETFARWNIGRRHRLIDHGSTLAAVVRWHPRLLLEAGVMIAPRAPSRLADSVNLAANWLNRYGHLEIARRTPGIHLIDQGVLQSYWSIGFAAGRDRLVAALTRSVASRPPMDGVVIVHATRSTLVRRLERRSGQTSRLERMLGAPSDPVARAAREFAFLCEHVRALAALHGWDVFEVDNDAEDHAASTVAQLLPWIEHTLAARGSVPARTQVRGERSGTHGRP